jgi:hypothetical protein
MRHREVSFKYHGAGWLCAPQAAMVGAGPRPAHNGSYKTKKESDVMTEQVTTTVEAPAEQQVVTNPAAPQQPNVISDPREIAAVIMARMNLINAKKDELTIAIKGLTDLTQQLVRAYAGQMQFIQQLSTRLKALEETVGTKGMNGHAAAPGVHSA